MRKKTKGKPDDEVIDFPVEFLDKAELEAALHGRIAHHRFIMPVLLLCQLQFGAIDRDSLIEFIMEFDASSIKEALSALKAQGLR